jgi:hypothetical protein
MEDQLGDGIVDSDFYWSNLGPMAQAITSRAIGAKTRGFSS